MSKLILELDPWGPPPWERLHLLTETAAGFQAREIPPRVMYDGFERGACRLARLSAGEKFRFYLGFFTARPQATRRVTLLEINLPEE